MNVSQAHSLSGYLFRRRTEWRGKHLIDISSCEKQVTVRLATEGASAILLCIGTLETIIHGLGVILTFPFSCSDRCSNWSKARKASFKQSALVIPMSFLSLFTNFFDSPIEDNLRSTMDVLHQPLLS